MKINSSPRPTKKLVLLSAVVLVVLAAAGVAASGVWHQDSSPAPTPSQYPAKTGTSTDEALERQKTQDTAPPATGESSSKTNAHVPTLNGVYFNAANAGGDGSLTVRAMVADVTSGMCIMTARAPSGKIVTQEAPLGLVSNYYACQGFTVPATDVTEKGDWVVGIAYRDATGAMSSVVERKVVVF